MQPAPSSPDPRRNEAASVSVIVSTNGRRAALADLLGALPFQRHAPFELVVVCGPEPDGTREMVAAQAQAGRLKMAVCDEAHLARSRNRGLSQAAGALVAFIDDDAIPEPVWLEELVALFADATVVAAGGRVYGPDGRSLQFLHSLCDRFGDVHEGGSQKPDGADCFPLSSAFPHLMGTNAVFRRAAVAAAGGFDEAYSYFLEETDLCVRLMDTGGRIRQTGAAPVHHRFLPGTVRGEGARALPILRSRIYFPLVNGADHAGLDEILQRSIAFVAERRRRVREAVAANATHPMAEEEFEADAQTAWREGLLAGLSGQRRLRPAADFAGPPAFLPFPAHSPRGAARHVALLAAARPATVSAQAAVFARGGDIVRVLHPAGPGEATEMGFEDGVFLQAVPVEHAYEIPSGIGAGGARDWLRSAALLAEIERLDAVRAVDAVVELAPPLAAAVRRAGRFVVLDALPEPDALFDGSTDP